MVVLCIDYRQLTTRIRDRYQPRQVNQGDRDDDELFNVSLGSCEPTPGTSVEVRGQGVGTVVAYRPKR